MLSQPDRLLLQFRDTESADGLHKIGRHCHQQTHFSLKSTWCIRVASYRRGASPLQSLGQLAVLLIVSTRQ
jgi:hypothetical protein